ncbi:MAG: HNH endonuclease [Solirubrobacterales bacterium]|nr:HNH endonuclease [Solirubrobacterales bacterium]
MPPGDDPDLDLRRVAIERVRELAQRHDGLVPVGVLREGFAFAGTRVSYGSFYSGIFRPRQMRGPAALAVVTTPPKDRRDAPYDDGFDQATQTFTYHYRTAQQPTPQAAMAAEADNRALRAAHRLLVPLVYFHGIAPGQYTPLAPMFVVADDPVARVVRMQAALPVADLGAGGLVSDEPMRRYATREALVRLHQHRFRVDVLRAYARRCAVCSLREAALLQAAHIIEDRDPHGGAAVVNGIALCAIHHLAYDRNLMGIDPDGVVHIAHRLREEQDGPMLKTGLQSFHGAGLLQPRRRDERPDPERLEVRFERFRRAL